jgi:hypothetical protein
VNGGVTLIVGDARGLIRAWILVKPDKAVTPVGAVLTLARELSGPRAAVTALGVSSRGRLFAAGFGIDAYLAVGWFFNHWIGDRPLLSLGLLMMIVGIQFIFFGLIAEMIAFSSTDRDDYAIVSDTTSSNEKSSERTPM